MRILLLLLMSTTLAYAGNSVTVTSTGNRQNVNITQFSAGHSAVVNVSGDSVSFTGSQSGSVPQSYSITISCGSTCPTSPYTIEQY